MVRDPQLWSLTTPDDRRVPTWLRGSIGLSLETPWESSRKTRIWQLVWDGLIRGFETPDWCHPEFVALPARKSATQMVLGPWLPGGDGITRPRMADLLDSSWLADERLFCDASTLRSAALRSEVRVDLMRLAIAVAIHRRDRNQPPERLADVANLFPVGLPIDPYCGQPYRYEAADGNSRVWSTGPDRVDDGGRIDGDRVPDNDPRWRRGMLDLVKNEPTWP